MDGQQGGENRSNGRKKALLVSVLAFLLTGGAVFLFFVIQGSRELTGANRKGAFTYGEAAREGASSFFKLIGFDDVESITSAGEKERLREKEYSEAGLLDTLASAQPAAAEEAVPWGAPSASGRPAAPSNIPKMGGSTAGLGAMGGAGTRSSGGASRFGGDSGAGNTRVSAAAKDSGPEVAGKGTLASLVKTRALLGDGLRSGSANTAKGKWDASFGVGRSGSGGSDLAYGKAGLVGLDKIKKGEVDNLKTTDIKSLKTPEVGAPVKDKEAEAKDKAAKDAKKAVEDAVTKGMASSVAGAMGQGLSAGAKPAGGGQSQSGNGGTDRGGLLSQAGMESGTCSSNSSSNLCKAALSNVLPTDSEVSYQQIGVTPQGEKIIQITHPGTGPGITEQYKGQEVPYKDVCNAVVGKDGTVRITGWFPPLEGPSVGN